MGKAPLCPTCHEEMVLKPKEPIDVSYQVTTTGITGTSTYSTTTELPSDASVTRSEDSVVKPSAYDGKPNAVFVKNYVCEKCGHEEQLWTREGGVKAL